jgi:HK97 family phage portal protein
MKLPKILEKTVLESENVKEKLEAEVTKIKEELSQDLKTKYNKEVTEKVNEALDSAKKDWSEETIKALDRKFGSSRKYVSTSGASQETFIGNQYDSGKNFNTLNTLYSDSPGSIQSAFRIRDAVLGGGYVIKEEVGNKGKKSDLKRLLQFFDRPNPDDTIETLIQVGIEDYLCYGNWFMEKVPTRGSAGRKNPELAELYNLDPTKMTILVDADLKKKGVLKKAGYKQLTDVGKSIIYAENEVIQIRRPNKKADLYGRAVLEDNMATLQLLLRALTYNINILKNGGRPPLQLILPEDSTESDAEAVSAFWEKNYQGPHNAGKTLVSFKGAKAEPLGMSPQDMAYLELLNYGMRLVAGQYGVPLFLIGVPEGSNRASSAELRRSFYLSLIFPLRKLISQKITQEIIKDGLGIEGWRFDFRTAGLEESESSRRDFMTGWTRGLYSFNEARIAMGLLPLEEKWANEYYLVGSKNDSLLPIKDAIGRISEDGTNSDKDTSDDEQDQDENRNPNDGQSQDVEDIPSSNNPGYQTPTE